jgi:hypothetical protein
VKISTRQKLNRPLRSMWALTSGAAPYYYHESVGGLEPSLPACGGCCLRGRAVRTGEMSKRCQLSERCQLIDDGCELRRVPSRDQRMLHVGFYQIWNSIGSVIQVVGNSAFEPAPS